MTEVLLTDRDRFPFDAANRATLASAGVALTECDGHAADAIAAAGREAAAVFVYHAKLTAGLIARLPALRAIARCGSGYDNIDVAAARARGIEVLYVPDYGVEDVADHTLALLLALARRVPASDRALRDGRWLAYAQLGEMRRLRGGVLGLLGFGRIARAVGARAQAFGMELLVHDPGVEEIDLSIAGARRAADADALLAEADAVSIHLPLTAATRGLIGAAELARMRPGALLVNTSRGEIVDEAALAAALADGRLGGAGLDVFEAEPLSPESPLLRMESAVVTPHSAAFSEQALAEVRTRALDDVLRVLAGQSPRDPVPVSR
ncbi:MAG: D-isomer specific 2-hydroxyacid dehydrogenase NAD-binding protein [Conexibacter sp.]|nr:D-isomer specific 2-hydroxyacid dehydrogenase NAD-binding protein [Conexibacter sp.]